MMSNPDSYSPQHIQRDSQEKQEDLDAVLAVEQAWLRIKRENEELRRQNEVLSETLQYLQEKMREMEAQFNDVLAEQLRAEELVEIERRNREALEWETEQLRQRLSKAVEMISADHSKSWVKRLFSR